MSLHYLLLHSANISDTRQMTNGMSTQEIRTVISAAVTRICLEMCVDCDVEASTSCEDEFASNADFPDVDSLPHQTSLEFHKNHSASVMTSEQTPPGRRLIPSI